MSVTLKDINALTNLPPVGATISPAMIVTHMPSSIEKRFFGSYKQLQTLYGNTATEPKHVERVAFIHYWLCLYGGMATLQDQLRSSASPTSSGPLWLTQLWLRRVSTFSPIASQSHVILSPSVVPIIEEPENLESLAQMDEMAQSTLAEGLAIVAYTPNPNMFIQQFWSMKDVDSILRSIQASFTSCEQVKTSSTQHFSSMTHPSSSSIPSTEDMNILKKAMLAYTSFMDKDISRVSVDSQKDLLAYLIEDLADDLKLPALELSSSIRLTFKGIHEEVSLLLSENVELRAKKMSLIQDIAEESLNIDINSAKSKLNELSSKVMIEDSFLTSLESDMKELQAKIDDCKMRLATKKHNAYLEIK
ncbi:Uncharacterized protein Adt_31466 [Abeliophyllum distichum]|uniref:Aminotransferase-like plant mobile domain-containing protein n=1 Tax=Abeliophyllum distichum TaxID=126358 RepID=A0ABD1RE93_9LAMI